MTSSLAAAIVAGAVLYAWRCNGQHRDLTARLTQAMADCCQARSRVLEEQAKNRRLTFLLASIGITPPRDGAPWPAPDPDPRPVHGPPDPAPTAPWWCHTPPLEADPEGELIGGVFHLDPRLVRTGEVVLPWLEGVGR